VNAVRVTERSLGKIYFGVSPQESNSRIFRRSLFVVENVTQGETFTAKNVRSIRPAHGLHTRHLPEILGMHAACDIECGTPMSWDLVAEKSVKPTLAGQSQR
jgi:pseudaminic acid synthase